MSTPVEPSLPECSPTEAHMQTARAFVAAHGEQNEIIDSGGKARLEWSPTHTAHDIAQLLASQEAKLRSDLHEAFAKEAKEVTDEVIARMEKDRVEVEALRTRLETILSHLDPDGDCDTDVEPEQLSRFVLKVLDAHVAGGEQGAQGEIEALKEELDALRKREVRHLFVVKQLLSAANLAFSAIALAGDGAESRERMTLAHAALTEALSGTTDYGATE